MLYIEEVIDKAPFLLMFIIIFSGFIVFSNIKSMEEKIDWYFEVLGPMVVLYTGKHLNKTGQKWRPVFIISLLLFVLLAFIE